MENDPLREYVEEKHQQLFQHIDARFEDLNKKIESGFPYGDLIEHRKVHESYIKEAAERAALWKSVREKTITGIVWAGLMLIGSALWEFAKVALKSAN